MMCHYKIKCIAAFTIIELLIVMVILSLSISMVSPVLINQIASYRQKSELHQLKNLIESVRDQAFFSGKSDIVKIEKGEVIFQKNKMTFQNIILLDQELVVTDRYQVFPEQLKYKVGSSDETKVLQLDD